MTEEEKRLKAFAFMAAEKARLNSRAHSPLDATTANIETSLRRSDRNRELFSTLAQNGITWEELREAYHTAFKTGHSAMLTYKLSFFYAGAAIAFHELFPSSPEETAAFIEQMVDIAEECPDRAAIVSQCLAETGVDTSVFDEKSSFTPDRALMTISTATRKDREAVERMRRTGITEKDLEYEKQIGYKNGWNTAPG